MSTYLPESTEVESGAFAFAQGFDARLEADVSNSDARIPKLLAVGHHSARWLGILSHWIRAESKRYVDRPRMPDRHAQFLGCIAYLMHLVEDYEAVRLLHEELVVAVLPPTSDPVEIGGVRELTYHRACIGLACKTIDSIDRDFLAREAIHYQIDGADAFADDILEVLPELAAAVDRLPVFSMVDFRMMLEREWLLLTRCYVNAEPNSDPDESAECEWDPMEQKILDALNGKAMKAEALANKVDVPRRGLNAKKNKRGTKTPGLLDRLRAHGKVEYSRHLGGFYRPDALPPSTS